MKRSFAEENAKPGRRKYLEGHGALLRGGEGILKDENSFKAQWGGIKGQREILAMEGR